MKLSAYDKECLEAAKNIIDKDSSQHYTIQVISQKVGIGSTKLKNGFKALHGMGLYEYLQHQRMHKAMVQLKETEKSIKQIAKTSGFKHTNNFTAAFKKRFGVSPAKIKAGN